MKHIEVTTAQIIPNVYTCKCLRSLLVTNGNQPHFHMPNAKI